MKSFPRYLLYYNHAGFTLANWSTPRIKNVLSTAGIVVILSTLVSPLSQLAHAQDPEPGFLEYRNPEFGLTINYVDTWTVEEDNTYLDSEYDVVGFISPADDETDDIYEYVTIAVIPGFSSDADLGQVADFAIESLEESMDNFDLVESVPTTLDGNAAHRIVFTGSFLGFEEKGMTLLTIENELLYLFKFYAGLDTYSGLLPVINEMTSSLKIDAIADTDRVPVPDDGKLAIFKNSTYGIEIGYPVDWVISPDLPSEDEIPNFYDVVTFESPSSASKVPVSVFVGVERIPKSMTLGEYTEASLSYVDDEGSKIDLLESTGTTLSGKLAHRVEYTMTADESIGMKAKVMQVWTINSGIAYVITYVAMGDSYEKYLPTVERMIESFKITAVTGLSSGPTKTFVPYENEALAISLERPDDWQESTISPTSIRFSPPTFGGSVNIFYVDGLGLFTLDQITETAISDLKKEVSLFRLLESNTTTLSGLPARMLVYSGLFDPTGNGKALMYKVTQIWALSESRVYGVTYAFFEEDYQTLLPAAQRMINTLEIDTSASAPILRGAFTDPTSSLSIVLPKGWKGVSSPQVLGDDSPFTTGVLSIPEDLDISKVMGGQNSGDYYGMMIMSGDINKILGSAANDEEEVCRQSSETTVDWMNSELKALVFLGDCDFAFVEGEAKVKSYVVATDSGDLVYLVYFANSQNTFDEHISEFEESAKTAKLENALDLSDARAIYSIERYSQQNYKVSDEPVVVGNSTYTLQTATNSTLSEFKLDTERKSLSFKVDGNDGTSGLTSLEVSKVLEGPYTVLVDGEPAEDVSMLEDRTTNMTILTVGYTHSVHEITISGTNVVPEISLTLVTLVIAVSFGVITVALRRRIGLA